MKTSLVTIVVSAMCIAAEAFVTVMGQARGEAPAVTTTPAKPVPRTSWDGHPNLSGVWGGHNMSVREANLVALDRLYRPEVAPQRNQLTEKDDPVLRCVPYGYPRAITMVHPTQIVQAPGVVLMLAEYGHSFRVIPADGRQHPAVLQPSYQGNSVAHWEGDTLVVDVTGFNGQLWLGHGLQKIAPAGTRGWITSDALHMVERWRLLDGDTLEYRAVVEDPKVLTGPWTTTITRYREAYDKIEEALCIDASLIRGLVADQELGTAPK